MPASFSRKLFIICYINVCIIWGSTYLAIAYGLKGFPPFIFVGIRFLMAGGILIGWQAFKNEKIAILKNWVRNAIAGSLILLGGVGMLTWGEQYITSSEAAVAAAAGPFWFILFDKKNWKINLAQKKMLMGMVIGFMGLLVFLSGMINTDAIKQSSSMKVIAFIVINLGSISFVLGSLYARSKPSTNSIWMNVGQQLCSAGTIACLIAMGRGEWVGFNLLAVQTSAWLGLLFLVIMGSIVAYLSYIWLVSNANPVLSSTYIFINPMVAVILGWLFLGQVLSMRQIAGMIVILTGVLFTLNIKIKPVFFRSKQAGLWILLAGFGLITPLQLSSQSSPLREKCGTLAHETFLQQKIAALPNTHQSPIATMNYSLTNPGTIVIPVVVHVVYANDSENISDLQVKTQIDALNRDYNKLNADTTAIPSCWKPLAANIGFQFCLANKTPSGKDTNGITRTFTTHSQFGIDDTVKMVSPVWDPTRYLNLWVCNLGPNYYGYSQFPYHLRDLPATDGVVINYYAFGQTGSADAPSIYGRTAVHEVGHWFNLIHPWGDTYCGTDSVEDTPPQSGAHYNCNVTFPDLQTNCPNNAEPNGTMYCNYMDYSDDPCLLLFTQGQKARMVDALNKYRPLILTSNACTAVLPVTTPPLQSLLMGPNPAGTTLNFTAGEPMLRIAIINLLGQQLQDLSFSSGNSGGPNQPTSFYQAVDVSNLPSGVYFFRVSTASWTTTKRVVISH